MTPSGGQWRLGSSCVRLYVGPMDAVLVEFDDQGLVRFDGED